MRGNWRRFELIAASCLLFSAAAAPAQSAPETSAASAKAPASAGLPGLLQFVDGGYLHGRLASVQPQKHLEWQHPDARQTIQFKPDDIAWIRFENSRPIVADAHPACWFHFANGDEVFGKLLSIGADQAQVESWFGKNLSLPRAALRSIQFLPKDFSIFYEGPTNLDGWTVGQQPGVWRYRDGALIADRVGMIGRDFHLSSASTVEFDLSWTGQFYLIMPFYTKSVDRFDYGANSYMFYIRPGFITLQRIQANAGSINLGQAEIPETLNKHEVHLEFHANKEEGTLTVLADGKIVQRWKDPMGFAGEGSGLVLYAQLNQSAIRVSNIRVWQGDNGLGSNAANADTATADWVYLANRDKMSGTLHNIESGALSFEVDQTRVSLPLKRVTQIIFAHAKCDSLAKSPWQARVLFAGGGAVTLQLINWTEQEVIGRSPIFGEIRFSPRAIRMLQFNSAQADTALASEKNDDWKDFDIK